MKLNVVFVITAIVLILSGILSFFAPTSITGTDIQAIFSAKILGVIYLSLGVMAWLVRNAEPSKTRNSIVFGYILLFVLWTGVSIYGSFLTEMPNHSISWLPALIQALLAIGFITARKSPKQKIAD
jgi:apolipoprotein N-acyltransferase